MNGPLFSPSFLSILRRLLPKIFGPYAENWLFLFSYHPQSRFWGMCNFDLLRFGALKMAFTDDSRQTRCNQKGEYGCLRGPCAFEFGILVFFRFSLVGRCYVGLIPYTSLLMTPWHRYEHLVSFYEWIMARLLTSTLTWLEYYRILLFAIFIGLWAKFSIKQILKYYLINAIDGSVNVLRFGIQHILSVNIATLKQLKRYLTTLEFYYPFLAVYATSARCLNFLITRLSIHSFSPLLRSRAQRSR